MDTIDFVKSIYLGDRACKAIVIDSWNDKIKFQITCISRFKVANEQWTYDQNIYDGWFVFNNACSITFDPPGHIPDDSIELFTAELDTTEGTKMYRFTLLIGSGKPVGPPVYVTITILAESIHIEDPSDPLTIITE